jgi:hypothetical protein
MPLVSGTQFGPYEIVSALGAGGMGEVYRAHDARIGREVALKVLPDLFATDPERRARFQREAQMLGSLNHPNIAQICGVEDAGGTLALAMELVPGPTLAELIAGARGSANRRAGLPVADALAIAKQIAEALEAAHDKGIVHRDLKPANVKVTEDGVVKVLDFGLAKALDKPGAPNAEAMNSPTLTARGTELGVILGTAAYMAPEQARGKVVDKRADVWAFGCVLYEMLTGTRAFQGDDISDILAAVLRSEPDWSALPVDLPPALRAFLERCLLKDRGQRIADISTARFLLTDPALLSLGASAGALSPERARRWVRPSLLVGAALVAAGLGAAGAMRTLNRGEAPAGVAGLVRLAITLPDGDSVSEGGTLVYVAAGARRLDRRVVWVDRAGTVEPLPLPPRHYSELALSPDGQQIALQIEDGTHGVWIYDVARASLTPLAVTNGSSQAPVWTADAKHVVYRATRHGSRDLFWKATDGTSEEERLTPAGNGTQTPSSWSADGGIVAFTGSSEKTGGDIWFMNPASHATRTMFLATANNEWNARFSPNGRWLAYQSLESGRPEVYVQPFPGPGPRHLISTEGGIEPVWSADGRELFYLHRGAMMAVGITEVPVFAAAAPRRLFQGQFRQSATASSAYAVSKDGRRFLRIQAVHNEGPVTEVRVVLNWFDELRRPPG